MLVHGWIFGMLEGMSRRTHPTLEPLDMFWAIPGLPVCSFPKTLHPLHLAKRAGNRQLSGGKAQMSHQPHQARLRERQLFFGKISLLPGIQSKNTLIPLLWSARLTTRTWCSACTWDHVCIRTYRKPKETSHTQSFGKYLPNTSLWQRLYCTPCGCQGNLHTPAEEVRRMQSINRSINKYTYTYV